MLLFDERLMTFCMGNGVTLEDTNGNRKLWKKRYEHKIDSVAAMMDAFVAFKLNKDAFEKRRKVYENLDAHVVECEYDVRCFGYDPYNAKDFVERWESENGPFGIEKVIQGAKTESVPLGALKKLAEERMLLFDEHLMTFCMGNCITLEDTNGNRKLWKKRYEHKIDSVAAMMDAFVAFKLNKDAFE